MAKATLHGKSAVITSSVKMEEIERMTKYAPEGLRLLDEKGKTQFVIGQGKEVSINRYGITFNDTDVDGFARVTLCDIADRQDFVDNFGKTILALTDLEAVIEENSAELTAKLATIDAKITVID